MTKSGENDMSGRINIHVQSTWYFICVQGTTGYAGGEKKRALALSEESLQKSSFVLNCMQADNRTQVKNKGERYYEKSK